MRGPIDYFVIGFEGNKFEGNILRELSSAVKSGTISVLSLGIIIKDEEGNITSTELTDLNDPVLNEVVGGLSLDNSLITDEDVEEIGEILENNTAAGLLVIEHLWAKGIKKAIVDAGGFLLVDGRIHPDAISELESKE